MSTFCLSRWTRTATVPNFAVFSVFLLLKPERLTVSRIHPNWYTIYLFNHASIVNFQGMSTSVTVDTVDDVFADSLLSSGNIQL